MAKGNSGNRFSTEVRARGVRMVLENEADYKSRSQAIASIAEKIGCSRGTLRDWVNRQAVEDGERDGLIPGCDDRHLSQPGSARAALERAATRMSLHPRALV